jgi:hypothetical protein
LLARFGNTQHVTIKRFTRTGYDAEQGAFDTTTSTEETVAAVVTKYDIREIDNTKIQRDDRRVIVAGNVALPDKQDRLVIGGVEMEIIDIEPHDPAGTLVAFEIQARA